MNDATFTDAIMVAADANPNSVVCDLLMLFDVETVSKILVTFSGERVSFPRVEDLWGSFRTAVIKDMLDMEDSKVNREQLAVYFNTSVEKVGQTYDAARAAKPPAPTKAAVERAANRAYRNKFEGLMLDMRKTLYPK